MSALVLAAALAAGTASAQVRIGASAEAGLSGTSGASVSGTLGGAAAPAFAPSLSPAALTPSLLAPAAPALSQPVLAAAVPAALVPAAAVPAAAKAESMSAALEALAPANLGKISGENAKDLSARALGLDEVRRGSSDAGAVAGRFAASASDLGPSSGGAPEPAREPRRPAPSRSKSPPTAADSWHHARLIAQNYYWYSVTHIVNMWPAYRRRWEEAKVHGAANVSRPRAFFAYMRIAAISGRFYVLGAAPLEDDAVISKFRETLLKWYDAPGAVTPETLKAFDDFTHRAKMYNAERRAPSNMRKHIRDALIKGSTMDPKKLASFFDSLLLEETARETADFQNKGAQKRILDAFTAVVRETLAEEPAGLKGRVRAAILLGSFATGSAGPKSDFDVELLTDNGNNARSVAFIKRLTDRWIATGHHARNPVTVHDFPSTPSRGIIDLVHTGDFIVISLDEALARELQRVPGDYEPKMIRAESLRGRLNRAVQYGVIVASTYAGDFRARFGAASGGHH
ncbi:MAG: nucleotidyltransferase domain-containing protein [Elusimicrobiota bacterium]|nr:MAG: nucleotidyltransferase domain-containing protein [Elusimicrobiota bacterium]